MANKLFVGGLAWETTDDKLKALFLQAGQVTSAAVIIDRFTGKSKGFGFVEMATDAEAAEAIKKFNGTDLDGRKIIVNEARPKPEGGNDRPFNRGGFSGGDRRGGGFNRGGGDRRGGYR